jgi:hypothetical protein
MGRSFYPVPPWESRRRLSRRGQSWRSASDLGSDAAGVAARTLASVAASGKPFEQVLLIHDAWRDRATVEAIERLDFKRLGPQDACSFSALNGALCVASESGWRIARLALRHSGETSGEYGRLAGVVGYGAWALSANSAS